MKQIKDQICSEVWSRLEIDGNQQSELVFISFSCPELNQRIADHISWALCHKAAANPLLTVDKSNNLHLKHLHPPPSTLTGLPIPYVNSPNKNVVAV